MNRKRNRRTPAAHASLVLGIECGGTRSVAVLADAHGRLVRRLEVKAPANLRLLRQAELIGLLKRIASRVPRPAAVGLGMAGVLNESDRRRSRSATRRVWPGVPCWAGNDLETALAAAGNSPGIPESARVMVISGTGASCYAKPAGGGEILTGGWGHLLGDRGSGYAIVLGALRDVFLEFDESGRWPGLGDRLLRALRLRDPAGLVGWVGAAEKSAVSALAVHIFQAAAEGDRVAARTLERAADWIARTAVACARRAAAEPAPVDFVLTGSVLTHQETFARAVGDRLKRAWPGATVRLLPREGAWGAARLAGDLLNLPPEVFASQPVAAPTLPAPAASLAKEIPGFRAPSPTEQRHPLSKTLDTMPVLQAIRLMLGEDRQLPAALLKEERKLARAVGLIARSFRRGGRLFYVGAGTSGRLGALDAYECPPTFSVPPERVQAIVAGGDRALGGAMEDAEDDFAGGARALQDRDPGPRDVVVGIAASGRTPFVWGALHAASVAGAATILVCFNPQLVFRRGTRPTLVIAPNLGPEILTGSTRLKAGTATKLILNLFTTLAMVRLGKTIENLMVDVHPTNAKLRDRAARIVRELTGAGPEVALQALERTGWSVRKALGLLAKARPRAGAVAWRGAGA